MHPGPWQSFWQVLTRFQKDKVTPWIALRNTLGVAVPLTAGYLLGLPGGGLACATGALNVSYSDSHDPYGQRARRMMAASVLVSLAVFFGALVGHNHLVAIIVAGVASLIAGMMVALSTTAADLGVITLVTLLVYSAVPQTPERAVYAGLLALAGGLFQTLLSLSLWPVRRYAAERQALSELYRELARAAALPVQVLAAPPASGPMTRAQTIVGSLRDSRGVDAERYWLLLNQAERSRLSLLTAVRLHTRLERLSPESPARQATMQFMEACSQAMRAISDALSAGSPTAAPPVLWSVLDSLAEQVRRVLPGSSPQTMALLGDLAAQMDALAGQLRSATDLAQATSPAGDEAFEQRELSRPQRLRVAGPLATVRANLCLGSAAFRHALRLAACVCLGEALGRIFSLHRAYWIR